MSIRLAVKNVVHALALAIVFPSAALSGFGRWREMYIVCAHLYALAPGLPGNILRSAYYRLTLSSCSIDTNIAFGTVIVDPHARIGFYTSIGSYCIIGRVRIGAHAQIGSHVEIPSGRHQHHRDASGRLSSTHDEETAIGDWCWIGSAAVVLATVGEGSTIGAGAVV